MDSRGVFIRQHRFRCRFYRFTRDASGHTGHSHISSKPSGVSLFMHATLRTEKQWLSASVAVESRFAYALKTIRFPIGTNQPKEERSIIYYCHDGDGAGDQNLELVLQAGAITQTIGQFFVVCGDFQRSTQERKEIILRSVLQGVAVDAKDSIYISGASTSEINFFKEVSWCFGTLARFLELDGRTRQAQTIRKPTKLRIFTSIGCGVPSPFREDFLSIAMNIRN